MGYPIRKLSDILINEQKLRELDASFYTFILYKEEHKEFRKFILKNFNKLHNISGISRAILFVLDFPDEWMKRKDIGYYHNIQGIDYQPALKDVEVDEVCKHFKVHPESLPAVIVFKDFHSQGCTSISLKDANDEDQLHKFFKKLYSNDYGLFEFTRKYEVNPDFLIREHDHSLPFMEINKTIFGDEGNILHILKELYKKMERAEQQLNRIEKKVDKIAELMEALQYDIETIKKTKRNEEEKIKLIYTKIDRKLSGLNETLKEDIQDYEEILKEFVEKWDQLDDLSKSMLPMADYLFDTLSRLKDADYSPVILQYCRTLENELLKKLFIQFNQHLFNNFGDLETFLQIDLSHNKTYKFAESLLKYKNKKPSDVKYTLGEMGRILEYTGGKNTIKESPLLQEFKRFISDYFDETFILSKEFLKNIRMITEDYRNKCAHPYKLNEDDAIKCKQIVPFDINDFLNNRKSIN